LLNDYSSENDDAQDLEGEVGSSSEVHGYDGLTLKKHERKLSEEGAEEEGLWSIPLASSSDVG
jgi:hypothetical protein